MFAYLDISKTHPIIYAIYVTLVVQLVQMVKPIILVKVALLATMPRPPIQLFVCNAQTPAKIAFWLMIKLLNYAVPVKLV